MPSAHLVRAEFAWLLSQADYIRISRSLSKAMLPEFDGAEAQAEAEKDWVQDSRGMLAMSRAAFKDCMFELADVRGMQLRVIMLSKPCFGC